MNRSVWGKTNQVCAIFYLSLQIHTLFKFEHAPSQPQTPHRTTLQNHYLLFFNTLFVPLLLSFGLYKTTVMYCLIYLFYLCDIIAIILKCTLSNLFLTFIITKQTVNSKFFLSE